MDNTRALFEAFVAALDQRDDATWLSLFTEDGYYAVVRRVEHEQQSNFVLIGEDMKRMRARLTSGQELDKRRTAHILGVVRAADEGRRASATFFLCYDGRQAFSGEYQVELDVSRNPPRINRCTVVLDNLVITDPIYRPI